MVDRWHRSQWYIADVGPITGPLEKNGWLGIESGATTFYVAESGA